MVEDIIQRGVSLINKAEESGELYNNFRDVSKAARILSDLNDERADKLYIWMDERVGRESIENVCNYLIALRHKGYNSHHPRVRKLLAKLENKRRGDSWHQDIWLNAHIIRTMGEYGIACPKVIDFLLSKRRANGNWFDKIWVTSFGLLGLYYGGADEGEIGLSLEWVKQKQRDGFWHDDGTRDEVTTSLATKALLHVGEGTESPVIQESLVWIRSRLEESEDISTTMALLLPVMLIHTGRASPTTEYRTRTHIEYKETIVKIGTQVMGDIVEGDKIGEIVHGDKVGAGAMQIKDSVVQRSQLSVESTTEEGSAGGGVVIEDSVVQRSQMGAPDKDTDKTAIYRDTLRQALADGSISADEQNMLTSLRKSLGMSMEDHVRIEIALREELFEQIPGTCPSCQCKIEITWKVCPNCGMKLG